jgi:hypothetical protein
MIVDSFTMLKFRYAMRNYVKNIVDEFPGYVKEMK